MQVVGIILLLVLIGAIFEIISEFLSVYGIFIIIFILLCIVYCVVRQVRIRYKENGYITESNEKCYSLRQFWLCNLSIFTIFYLVYLRLCYLEFSEFYVGDIQFVYEFYGISIICIYCISSKVTRILFHNGITGIIHEYVVSLRRNKKYEDNYTLLYEEREIYCRKSTMIYLLRIMN